MNIWLSDFCISSPVNAKQFEQVKNHYPARKAAPEPLAHLKMKWII